MGNIKVGLVGCGMISDIYLQNLTGLFNGQVTLVACANRDMKKAEEKATKYHIAAMTIDQLLADPEIDCILNLTVPSVHYEINMKALKAHKSVYTEKPLAVTKEEGQELVKLAEKSGLFISSAPDTFLGAGIQTAKKLLEEKAIGTVLSAQANMLSVGPEYFHPNPESFYKVGAGPLMDMGPYCLTALVSLLGPVKEVAGFGWCPNTHRRSYVTGKEFECEVPTQLTSILKFESGVIGNLNMSWEMRMASGESGLPLIEIFGTEGQIIVGDPNQFNGKVSLRKGRGPFEEVPLVKGYALNARGLGLAEIASSLKHGTKWQISGQLALHVLEIMIGINQSQQSGKNTVIEDTCPLLPLFDSQCL